MRFWCLAVSKKMPKNFQYLYSSAETQKPVNRRQRKATVCLALKCSALRQVKDPERPWINRVCARLPTFSSFISYANHQHKRMFCVGILSNVPSGAAYGCCTVAAQSCIQWKAKNKFHVSFVDMWPISIPIPIQCYDFTKLDCIHGSYGTEDG